MRERGGRPTATPRTIKKNQRKKKGQSLIGQRIAGESRGDKKPQGCSKERLNK
jgi:hypothetical protein